MTCVLGLKRYCLGKEDDFIGALAEFYDIMFISKRGVIKSELEDLMGGGA